MERINNTIMSNGGNQSDWALYSHTTMTDGDRQSDWALNGGNQSDWALYSHTTMTDGDSQSEKVSYGGNRSDWALHNHTTMTDGDNQSDWALHGGNQSDWALYNRTVLLDLNDEMVRTLLPAILYLVVLMVVGTVGNCLTIYIYGFKFKPTTQNCLFMWLGVFDFVSCVMGIPSEIVDLSLYYLYDNGVLCKVLKFLLVLCSFSSINLLVVIAVNRYRHVCKPLHSQMEIVHARIGVGVAAAVAGVLAAPAAVLYGVRTVQTPVDGLDGCDCSVEDQYQGHVFPLLYKAFFMTCFISITFLLAFLYTRMCLEIRRCQRYIARHSISSVQLSSLRTSDPDGNGSSAIPDAAQSADTLHKDGQSEILVKTRKAIRASKSMWITLAVTVVFVFSYLPHLILILLRTAIADFDHQQTGVKHVLYNMFMRSYFINSVANVFIYSGMSLEFRSQCRQVCACVGWRQQ